MVFLQKWSNPPGRSKKALTDDGSGIAAGFSLLTTEHCIHWPSDKVVVNFTVYTIFLEEIKQCGTEQLQSGDAVPMPQLSQTQVWGCPQGQLCLAGGHKRTTLSKPLHWKIDQKVQVFA